MISENWTVTVLSSPWLTWYLISIIYFWTPLLYQTRTCCTIITWWESLAKIWPFWWLQIIIPLLHIVPISILKAFSLSHSLFLSWSSTTKILAYTKGRKKQASCYGILLVHKHHCTTSSSTTSVYFKRARGDLIWQRLWEGAV